MSNKRNEVFGSTSAVESTAKNIEAMQTVSANDWLEKEFGFKTQVYEVPLPSKGLLYPEGHPLHLVESVEFLPISTREEDIIRNKKLIENKTMGSELIRSCLANKRIDPKTLFPGDALAILYAIRTASYGAEYTTKVKCQSCGTVQKATIDLGELDIKEMPEEDIVPGVAVFSTKLPVSGMTVEYRIFTEDESAKLGDENDAREKRGVPSANSTVAMQSLIVSANGVSERGKINLLASRLPGQDALHLRQEVAKHEPGIINKYLFSCKNSDCRHEAMQGIPFGIEFWLPEADV